MGTNPDSAKIDLSGQVAIVTGGGRGLGRAFAQAMAAAGAKVAVTARTEAQLDETVGLIRSAGGAAIAFAADVTDRPAMERVAVEVEARLGPVDVLVNNAAVLEPLGYEWEVDPDAWWRLFEVNVRGPFVCTRTVLPGMMARRKGRIVNVSSIAAHALYPYITAYSGSKAALSHMTHVSADLLREYGISVFALAPSGPTAMVAAIADSDRVPDAVRADFRRSLAEDFEEFAISARLLMFLVSGQADALTGRHISFRDSIDDLLARTDEIVRDDLHTLQLRR